MTNFVDVEFERYIKILIRTNVMPNLELNEFDKLIDILIDVINYISIRFNFDLSNPSIYIHQLKQNNNRDIYAIFNLLLPYIDDNNDFELHKKIKKISDISLKKDPKLEEGFVDQSASSNINIIKNPYIITNIQYNMNTEINSDTILTINKTKNKNFIEYEYSLRDIRKNYYLLLNTIDQISNKLYVNWINIRPLSWNYKESSLYKKSFNYNKISKKIEANIDGEIVLLDWQDRLADNMISDKMKEYQGLSCGDIYNMIHHELYYGIKNVKWLIYEIPLDQINESIYNYWDYIRSVFNNINSTISYNTEYSEISDELKEKWIIKKKKILDDLESNKLLQQITYNIIYYLQRKYTNKSELQDSNFIELKIMGRNQRKNEFNEEETFDILDPDNIEDARNIEIRVDDIKTSWDSLEMDILYKYLMITINEFKKTWYGHQILILKKRYPDIDIVNINRMDRKDKVSFKNIYNWAKSILLQVYSGKETKLSSNIVSKMESYREYNWHMIGSSNYELLSELEKDQDNELLKNNILDHKRNFTEAINSSVIDNKWFNIKGILRKK